MGRLHELDQIRKIVDLGKKKYIVKKNKNTIILDKNAKKRSDKNDKKQNETDESKEIPENPLPWIEKYRPSKLSNIVGHDTSISILKKIIKTGNLPHLLLYGSPGTGKTSTATALVRELFGTSRKMLEERVMEKNASDDRGIFVIRTNIKNFAKQTIGRIDSKYPCPPFKIIILDEADHMTVDAQNALRKIIEIYSKTTRFIIICNDINLMTEPIRSRCARFYFAPLSVEQSLKRVKIIAKKENIELKDKIYKKILDMTDGDLRRSIMLLQNIKYCIKVNNKKIFTEDDLDLLQGAMPYKQFSKKLKNLTDVNSVISLAKEIIDNGHTANSTLDNISKYILDSNLNNKKKAKILFTIADSEKKLLEGTNEYYQFMVIFISIIENK